jgi:hypothetical protein
VTFAAAVGLSMGLAIPGMVDRSAGDEAGARDVGGAIRFHLAVELATGALLIAGAIAALTFTADWVPPHAGIRPRHPRLHRGQQPRLPRGSAAWRTVVLFGLIELVAVVALFLVMVDR